MQEFTFFSTIIERFVVFLPTLIWVCATLIIFFFIAHIGKRIILMVLKPRVQESARGFAGDIVFIVILIAGFMVALSLIGVNTTALAAGLGISGFIIAFALQSIISNAASGFFILLSGTFHSGDTIQVAGFDGTIRTIQLKHTILERDTEHGTEEILVPNNIIFNSGVVIKARGSRK